MSLSKYDGFVRADEYFDKRVASANLDAYKVVPNGGWAFSTIHIDEGSIARNTLGETGVISPMYTTMRWTSDRDLPEYAELLLREPGMVREYGARAQGSINRRRSLSFKSFVEIEVLLPPMQEQRRIVDVVSRVDALIAALSTEEAAASGVLGCVRNAIPVSKDVGIRSILRSIDGGKSVMTPGDPPIQGEPRILKLSAVRPGVFNANEAKHLPDVAGFGDSLLVSPGDLLITRANTPDKVGYVAIAREVPNQTYMSDLLWRLTVDESQCRPAYLEHALSSALMRSRITATASGTSSSMRKINKRGLGTVIVPLPSLDEQDAYIEVCDAQASVVATVRAEAHALRAFRTALASSLLTGSVSIPASYDALEENAEGIAS